MRILLAIDQYSPMVNGVITSVKTLRKGLEKMGHEVRVLTISQDKKTHEEDGVLYVGSMDVSFVYPDARWRLLVRRSAVNELIEWKPDVIHTNNEFSAFFLARTIARYVGCPIVHTYHTDYEQYVKYIHLKGKFGAWFVRKFIHHIVSCVSVVIAPTEKTKNELLCYNLYRDIHIIPTGLDLERFQRNITSEKREELLTKYNLKKNVPILLYLGRLGYEKNISELIDYLSKLKDLNFQFLVVGCGPAEENLKKEVKEKGLEDRTVFTGRVNQDETQDYYHLGSLFLSASTSETQGLTYIEALSSGTPLLCRKDECLENIVEEGKDGYLYENEEEFARYLRDFLNSNLSLSSREEIRLSSSRFNMDEFSEKVFKLYTHVLTNYKKKSIPRSRRIWNTILKRLPLI